MATSQKGYVGNTEAKTHVSYTKFTQFYMFIKAPCFLRLNSEGRLKSGCVDHSLSL